MIVLDTNVVSELVRPSPQPAVLTWLDHQPRHRLAITAVTAAELLHGVARLPAGRRRALLGEQILAVVHDDFDGRVLPFDLAAAEHFAELVVDRAEAGRTMPQADAQIAAICRSTGSRLATRNVKDFADTGVEVVNPWDEI